MSQKGLFPYPVLTEDELEAIVAPWYPQFWRMIREPFDDVLARRASDSGFRILEEGETAQWLRPQIIERARQIFDGNPDVKLEHKNQQYFLNCRNQVAVTPKKLKPRWRKPGLTFSSYETRQNKDY